MVCQVLVEIIGIDSVGDVGGDQETVGVCLSKNVGAVLLRREGFGDSFYGAGEEVTPSSLSEERPDFFVIK